VPSWARPPRIGAGACGRRRPRCARTRLAAYLEAEAAVLRNQSYQMPDGRQRHARQPGRDPQGHRVELRGELASATACRRVRGRARRGVIL
jgi:hypothetical protein